MILSPRRLTHKTLRLFFHLLWLPFGVLLALVFLLWAELVSWARGE